MNVASNLCTRTSISYLYFYSFLWLRLISINFTVLSINLLLQQQNFITCFVDSIVFDYFFSIFAIVISVGSRAVLNIHMHTHIQPIITATTHRIHIVTYKSFFLRLKSRIVRRILFYMTPFSMYICPRNDLKTQILIFNVRENK